MKWVTWQQIGVDRMACAWLILRYIDPNAEFAFIPMGGSLPEGYEPFDIPGVRMTHRQGHCTFHTFVSEYNLTDPVLQRLAHIVDEADLGQEIALEPAAFGLEMICRGLRLISADDPAAIAHGCLIYDALYALLSTSLGAKS